MWGKRRRRQSVEDYAYERLEQLHRLGGTVEGATQVELIPGEQIKIQAVVRDIGSTGRGWLEILEIVESDGDGVPTRVKYAYQAMYRKQRLFRYDRDPIAHPEMPEHLHRGQEERRQKASRVTLHGVMQELLAEVALRDRS